MPRSTPFVLRQICHEGTKAALVSWIPASGGMTVALSGAIRQIRPRSPQLRSNHLHPLHHGLQFAKRCLAAQVFHAAVRGQYRLFRRRYFSPSRIRTATSSGVSMFASSRSNTPTTMVLLGSLASTDRSRFGWAASMEMSSTTEFSSSAKTAYSVALFLTTVA